MKQTKKAKQKKKGGSFSTVLLLVIFLVGLSVMLYPAVSSWWNSMHMSRAVAAYQEAVEDTSKAEREAMLAAADDYNRRLFERHAGIGTNLEDYQSVLDITGTGIMGYITIQKLDLELPIYHGMDANVLQVGVGHVSGSSLPVGGENTFSVLSGHRGMPDARLFTDIDQLVKGDIFIITVLDRKIAYQVDDISTVLPREVEELRIVEGKDSCTLVTCTPYGINTHRLLVRGHRVALPDNTELPTAQEKIQGLDWKIKLLAVILLIFNREASGFCRVDGFGCESETCQQQRGQQAEQQFLRQLPNFQDVSHRIPSFSVFSFCVCRSDHGKGLPRQRRNAHRLGTEAKTPAGCQPSDRSEGQSRVFRQKNRSVSGYRRKNTDWGCGVYVFAVAGLDSRRKSGNRRLGLRRDYAAKKYRHAGAARQKTDRSDQKAG